MVCFCFAQVLEVLPTSEIYEQNVAGSVPRS